MGVMRPELVMKSIVPVVMAGVLGIYGLIIAVIISTGSEQIVSPCSLYCMKATAAQFPVCPRDLAVIQGDCPLLLLRGPRPSYSCMPGIA